MNPALSARLMPALVILVAMITAPILAEIMRPNVRIADTAPKLDLEAMIPKEFGEWKALPTSGMVIADPQTQVKLDRIYTQLLSRTYSDSRGRQIMLSIAYGEDQRDRMEMHYPEVCYPAQGFQARSIKTGRLSTQLGHIEVKRLEMVHGQRQEPVTYWTMIGELQSRGGVTKKLNEMRYSLQGIVPDGLLFRVSSIGADTNQAFIDQEEFVGVLLGSVSPEIRKRLAGI